MATSRAKQAETAARRAQAVALRLAGADLESIAEALKYAGKTVEVRRAAVSKDITRALDSAIKTQTANADALRQMELMRLDRMQAGLWAAAKAGDAKAVTAVLAISDRRCKLWGLDAPVKVDTTVTETTQVDVEFAELVREAQARSAAEEAALRGDDAGTQ